MSEITKQFIGSLRAKVSNRRAFKDIPKWIEENTSFPKDSSRKWSFAEHEFQKDIAGSSAPKQSTIKCSQIGLSDISIRKGLALSVLNPGINIIYTLPSGSFAGVFAKTRVGPIIKESKALSALLNQDTDNTKIKQIGSSFIYFMGTFSESSAISIPASMVVSDEVDFSDQSVLSDFSSRLGHEKEGEGQFIKFSTPTVEGYGISAEYAKSSKGRYQVQCEHCNTWSAPDFLQDVVIPELGVKADEVTKFDVIATPEKIKSAYCECQHCKKDLFTSLINPGRRQWVHEFPGKQKDHEGFKVCPLDVPAINPPHRTLAQMEDYKTLRNWKNFKLGQTDEASDSRFDVSVIDRVQRVVQATSRHWGCVAGIDVGKKQTWIALGKPTIDHVSQEILEIQVVSLQVLDSTALGETLGVKILDILHKNGVGSVVLDGAPDFTTAQIVSNGIRSGVGYGCYYSGSAAFSKILGYYKLNDNTGVCLADRTASIDVFCELFNACRILLPRCQEAQRVGEHLAGIKRLEISGGEGRWVKLENREDHWAHALNYLCLASDIFGSSRAAGNGVVLPLVGKSKVDYGEGVKF